MSIDRNTANTNSTNSLNTIQANADSNFIASVDAQIQNAISLGQFEITAVTNNAVNLNYIYNYYANLGYEVYFPDYQNQNGAQLPSIIQQPQNFFGANWVAFWNGLISLNLVQNPARLTINWSSYEPPVNAQEPV